VTDSPWERCPIRLSWIISVKPHLRCIKERPFLEGTLKGVGVLQELIETEESDSDFGYAYRVFDNEDILLELDGSNNITARYTHGPGIDEPLVMEKASQSFFYHADGLGSITEITNQSGTVVQAYTYSSFGKIESQLDPNFIQPYTFTSREFEPETGLYHYRKRDLDPNTGTFLQEDSILHAGNPTVPYLLRSLRRDPLTLQGRAYVNNNPLKYSDPHGLLSVWGVLKFAGKVGAGVLQVGPLSIALDLLGGPQCIGGCPLNAGEEQLLARWTEIQIELQRQRQFIEETDKFIEDLCRTGRYPLSCGPSGEPPLC